MFNIGDRVKFEVTDYKGDSFTRTGTIEGIATHNDEVASYRFHMFGNIAAENVSAID